MKPEVDYSFYVLKSGARYCRFGSYRKVTFVDSPFKATTFQREIDARKRADKRHVTDAQIVEWIGPGEFSIMKIDVADWVEEDVS